jgi:hypothetical protein
VGYWSHSDRLVRVLPGLQGMALLTAVGLLVLAGSIMAASFARPALSKGLAWSAIAVGGVALTSHLVFKADRLSPAIAQAVFGLDPSRSGHTSIATALCFLVLGAAGLNRARAALADGLGAVALILSSVAVIGYAYGVRDLYAVPVFNTMALHTACALILLSAASLIVLVDRGWAAVITSHEAGGGATRRQLTFILAPPIAGGLLLRATDAHALGPGAAMAFLVIITVTPLALLILRDGRVLNAVERERRDNAEELRRQLGRSGARTDPGQRGTRRGGSGDVPGPADGGRRPADRRDRARLQQPADGDQRQSAAAAGTPRGGSSGAPLRQQRHRRDR